MKKSNKIDMEIGERKRLLSILVENSARILRAGFGVESAKSTLYEIVDLVRNNKELELEFINMASDFLLAPEPEMKGSNVMPLELLELAAHELRLGELVDLAMERVSYRFKGDMRAAAGDVSVRILRAASDDWEDRDIFERSH
ncbi:hypothetical protein ACTJI2_06375 [Pseudoxanthomonas sp. 22568]|uniref:hypothetical protein n=1 Tax=Pseudoxanthomonas sp. 22568 TaxID=3453945 RepID=UPI003F87F12A